MRRTVIVMLIAMLSVFAGNISATIRNVPGDCETIQECINISSNRDTVLVWHGLYEENINFNSINIVLGSQYIIDGDKSHISQTIIDGGPSGSVITFNNYENMWAKVIGFTIRHINGSGAGVDCINSEPTISNNIIDGFSNSNTRGISCSYAFPKIDSNVIRNHNTSSGGSGIKSSNSGPIIEHNLIYNNVTTNNGGAINCSVDDLTIIRYNVICNNSAVNGGGIETASIEIDLINNTIAGNTATGCGGGIRIWNSGNSVDILNTIFWGNSADEDDEICINAEAGPITVTYCDIQGGWEGEGEGNIECDPGFCDVCPDYELIDTSCCVDAGEGGVNIGALGIGCRFSNYLPGDCNMALGLWPPSVIGGDVSYLVGYFIGAGNAPCKLDDFWASADVTGDCQVIGGDVSALVGFFIGTVPEILYCPDYEPAWLEGVPDDAPADWPNCDMPIINSKIIPTGSGK